MAAFDASAWLGARAVRPSTVELAELGRVGPAFFNINLENILRHLHYVAIPLGVASAVNAATVNGLAFPCPFPIKVVGFSVGCESAAGSAATAILAKAPAATPTTFATMLDAAQDIKTAAGYMQDAVILNGAENCAVDDNLRIQVTGTGAGAVVGTAGIVHAFRL